MFDISWTEFLLIAVVALIVIGPKELPSVLRTLGQWTRRVRSMAAEFQGQFQEAMREAEMADLKKQVDDIAYDIKSYDPLKDVRADVEAVGKDIRTSLEKPVLMTPAAEPTQAIAPIADDAVATATGPVTPEAAEHSAPELPTPEPSVAAPEGDFVAASTGPGAPETAEHVTEPDRTGHAG
jgi:sec-independent protein translocase protein TatB